MTYTFIPEPFQNRIQKNINALQKWVQQNDIHAYRIYDKDMPEYPFSVDKYDNNIVLHYYERRAQPKLFTPEHDLMRANIEITGAINALADLMKINKNQVFVKHRKNRSDGEQYNKVANRNNNLIIQEGGLQFIVNLSDYLDTGLFLDSRNSRAIIRSMSAQKKVLNLFAYTGSMSVYAAAGGAEEVTTVDLSNTYLDWAQENFKQNFINCASHKFIKADVLQFLEEQHYKYDIIVCDPPSFSNSKSMETFFDVQEHHASLLKLCKKALRPNGCILFSTNLRTFKLSPEIETDFTPCNITKKTLPPDFRNTKIHQTWLLNRK